MTNSIEDLKNVLKTNVVVTFVLFLKVLASTRASRAELHNSLSSSSLALVGRKWRLADVLQKILTRKNRVQQKISKQ